MYVPPGQSLHPGLSVASPLRGRGGNNRRRWEWWERMRCITQRRTSGAYIGRFRRFGSIGEFGNIGKFGERWWE
ncbi:MAG: hypothetical protein K2K52_04510 [Paramuribaculum sp.]|nr:hypothetical protein [Paramuribaculum sp.]